jgi:hypothetical protein
MEAPTYQEFRAWALSNGYTGRTLAPYVEADEPIKTATRILVFLAGTRWDHEPLPYLKLCRLYHGVSESKPQALEPYPPLTVADFRGTDIPRSHAVWMALWDAGWSCEKIATTWDQPLESVVEALDKLMCRPWPVRRLGAGGLSTKERATARRNRIRQLFHEQGWSLEQLRQAYPIYSRAILERIVKQREQEVLSRTCKDCGTLISGKRSTREYCNATCRKRAARRGDQSREKVALETA